MSSLQVDFSFLCVKLPAFPFFASVNAITVAFVTAISVLQMMKIKYNFNIPTSKMETLLFESLARWRREHDAIGSLAKRFWSRQNWRNSQILNRTTSQRSNAFYFKWKKIPVKNHVVSYTHIYVIIFIFNILISEHQRKKAAHNPSSFVFAIQR